MNGNICEHNFNVGVGINPTYEELINTLRPEIEAILIKRINQSGWVVVVVVVFAKIK